jgi:tetratricopeptide (TPR) repeat protein
MLNKSEATIVTCSKKLLLLDFAILFVLAAIILLIFLMITLPRITGAGGAVSVLFWGFFDVVCVFSIICCVWLEIGFILMIGLKSFGLRIDDKGVFDNSWPWSYGAISWDEIYYLEIHNHGLHISLKDTKSTFDHLKGIKKFWARKRSRQNSILINFAFLNVDANLADFIRRKNHELLAVEIKTESDNPKHYYSLARVYAEEGNGTLAMENYDKALKIKPDFGEVYLSRAGFYEKRHDYQQAIDDYTKAIEIFTIAFVTYMNKEEYSIQKRSSTKNNETQNCWPEVINNLLEAFENRANVYMQIKEYPEAIGDYSKIIEIDEPEDHHFYNRANAYILNGQTALAIDDLKKVIKMRSGYEKEAKKTLKSLKKN